MTHIAPLTTVGRSHHDRVGGKGANLGELLRAGLPVPDGFVITTEAYTDYVAANRLVQRIRTLVGAGGPEASEKIAAAFAAGRIPAGLRREILRAYADLGGGPVAVRSSATAEDLEDASFAGQQETYLHVRGADEVLRRVRDCWSSFFSERALFYRARKGALDDLRMAVVVQKMVEPEKSGVLFTADPVQRRRDQMVAEAVFGLGEQVVSGHVTPDHYVLDRTGKLKRSHIVNGGVLADDELRRLAELGQRLQEHFGTPQDIEWAIEDGELYVLQARPVTA